MFLIIYFQIFFILIVVLSVAIMDPNAKIIREMVRLRNISVVLRGGDIIHRSLSFTIGAIVDTITQKNGALYNIASYIDRKYQEYAYGLDHNAIKKLNIRKEDIFSLFRDP